MNKAQKIGLGTATIGRPHYINVRQERSSNFVMEDFRKQGIAVLEAAYQQGVRYFDTAPGYGMAEQLVLEWVLQKDDAEIQLATKWGYTYVANFDPNAVQHEVKEHSLKKLNEQWQQSQKLLPLLHIYQIHSATLDTGVLENEAVLHRLAALKAENDLIIGLSSTGDNQVEVLKKALDIEVDGLRLFDSFQVTYNVFDQSLAAFSEQLSREQKKIVVKEALANGRIFPNANYPQYARFYAVLKTMAQKYETSVDAIALRFCMDSIEVFKVLSGAANPQHLADNLKVELFSLEQADIEVLKAMAISPTVYWAERKKLGWN